MIKDVLSRLMVFIYAISFFLLIWPWYMSIDSRYLRDNYQYISERYAETGLGDKAVNTHYLNMIKYPEPITLAYLYMAEQDWTKAYLTFYTEEADEKQYIPNPQEYFTRLQLQANNPYVQNVYDSILWDMMILQDEEGIENILTENDTTNIGLVQAWMNDRPTYQKNAQASIKAMLSQFRASYTLFLMMTPFAGAAAYHLIFISGIFKHILKDKRISFKHNKEVQK